MNHQNASSTNCHDHNQSMLYLTREDLVSYLALFNMLKDQVQDKKERKEIKAVMKELKKTISLKQQYPGKIKFKEFDKEFSLSLEYHCPHTVQFILATRKTLGKPFERY